MNLFDELVTQALDTQPTLSSLRIVVEKELLHHDILRILSQHEMLHTLTFIGGTCLRACYGGIRLSEDLDFTGGASFTREQLTNMGEVLCESLHKKYNLSVSVKEPQKDINNVDTWKIKVETRPKQRHIPAQRINIDICQVPSYDKQPMMLLNPYGVDMGTNSLIIQAESQEEIYMDKLIAFALRPNRIKHRDIWDIIWLHQRNISPLINTLQNKLADHKIQPNDFISLYTNRLNELSSPATQDAFKKEMMRFLPPAQIESSLGQPLFWKFVCTHFESMLDTIKSQL